MSKTILKIMIIVSLHIVAAFFCFAQTNVTTNAFQAADTNLDGKISLDEFRQYAKKSAFESIDANRDGRIEKKEWLAADRSKQAEQNFQTADKQRDNQVDFLEFSDHAERCNNYDEVYKALDKNRDGSLAPDEFNARPAFMIFSVKF
jgi:Ca2+-binding EF-hand superfamily protein